MMKFQRKRKIQICFELDHLIIAYPAWLQCLWTQSGGM